MLEASPFFYVSMDKFIQRFPKGRPLPGRQEKESGMDPNSPPAKKQKLDDGVGPEISKTLIQNDDVKPKDSPTVKDNNSHQELPTIDDEAVLEEQPRAADNRDNEGDGLNVYDVIGATVDMKSTEQVETLQRMWVKGKSSIYVDAFNLALDNVLEDESYLFDEREMEVLNSWKALEYEPQYLYVRLFLRKSFVWHRIDRLGYYDDISNMDSAVETLQSARMLPEAPPLAPTQAEGGAPEHEDIMIGDSFSFADKSSEHINTIEEAICLLSLTELKVLAKEAMIQGKNKAEIQRAFCRMSNQQMGLLSMGMKRTLKDGAMGTDSSIVNTTLPPARQGMTMNSHYLTKILELTGSCIRLSGPAQRLFERVLLVFYRSTDWTEKSLTTIILAKISRRNFPEYIVDRSSNIFPSRTHLLEYEAAVRLESQVDALLEGPAAGSEARFKDVISIFDTVGPRWRKLLVEERKKEGGGQVYEFNEGAYLRRFNAAHSYTRIAHKAAYVYGRLKEHSKEHALLTELLGQKLFHPARRGGWYQRMALLEENYMYLLDPENDNSNNNGNPLISAIGNGSGALNFRLKAKRQAKVDQLRKKWRRQAAETCELGLQDGDCHVIYHYDLQKRLVKLERALNIPKRLQHDFGHVKLSAPLEHVAEGIQVVKAEDVDQGPAPGTKTMWVDLTLALPLPLSSSGLEDGESGDNGTDTGNTADIGDSNPPPCSVEEMCLSHYRAQGWKGYHAEGGILRTLFAYLFYDILFLYVPNVFQTAFQTCPLDLFTDGAFYAARASEINHRLVEIANGRAEELVRAVDERHRERRTAVVGLIWDFELEDIVELVGCFGGQGLAAVCRVFAEEYRGRGGGGGVPDLLLWRLWEEGEVDGATGLARQGRGEVMFVEVKSANDRLSDTQRLWIHVLSGAGVKVAVCKAVAKEVRVVE